MEQSVEVKYWRRQWLVPTFLSLYWLVNITYHIWESYSQKMDLGRSFSLGLPSVILLVSMVLLSLCAIIHPISRSIKKITINGDTISIVKMMGHTVSADLSEIAIFDYELFIGKRYSIRLDDIIQKEKIVDLLAGRVKHERVDNRFLRYISKATIAVTIVVLVLFGAARLMRPDILDSAIWVFVALISAVAVAFLVQIVWNIMMK